jgi:hypothetical protein
MTLSFLFSVACVLGSFFFLLCGQLEETRSTDERTVSSTLHEIWHTNTLLAPKSIPILRLSLLRCDKAMRQRHLTCKGTHTRTQNAVGKGEKSASLDGALPSLEARPCELAVLARADTPATWR